MAFWKTRDGNQVTWGRGGMRAQGVLIKEIRENCPMELEAAQGQKDPKKDVGEGPSREKMRMKDYQFKKR